MLLGFCFIGRLLYASSFLLAPDETNYWQWARHLAWGYHDQAPMIAWAIRMTTSVLGQTELAVRLPSVLAMTAASVYLVLIARHWFSPRIALCTVLLSQSILIFNIGGLLATADGLQGLAWVAASYHVARAFENNGWRQWFLAGGWFGFGMLSKYTMVLFLPCVFVFGLASSLHRRLFASIKPYLGCAVGMMMFLPVILWNAANNWNSVRHVAYIGGVDEQAVLHLKYFGDYIATQAGLLSPLVFFMIGAGWLWVIRKKYPREKWIIPYLCATSLPVFGFFALLSLHTRVYGNWPCAGYLTATVLAAVSVEMKHRGKGFAPQKSGHAFWRWTLISSYAITAVVLIQVLLPILPIAARHDRTAYEIRGWDRLGNQVAQIKSDMPHPERTFLFGLRYQIASELAFYVPGKPLTVAINRWNRPNVYDYWWQDSDLIGQDGIGVIRNGQSRTRLLEIFDRVDDPESFDVYRPSIWQRESTSPEPVKTLYIYRCYGFKGGLRWIPSNRHDIRAGSATQ